MQNHLPTWQLKEDKEFVSTRTFDFHKFAENFNANSSSQKWSSDSNELPEDFVLSKSPDPLTQTADSDSENEDEIFLVFRGKPNSRLSSFDECQAAAGMYSERHHPLLVKSPLDCIYMFPNTVYLIGALFALSDHFLASVLLSGYS